MRSARLIVATAAASAALALSAPGAYAAGDWDKDDSSYNHDDSSYGNKEHDDESKHEEDKEHDGPRGGMHTGGGALTTVKGDDWKKDDSSSRDEEHGDKEHGDKEYGDEGKHDEEKGHESPRGGMHTGGGALSAVNADDWGTARDPKHDPETYKKDNEQGKGSGSWSKEDEGNDSWGGGEKPNGGVHTGGGALSSPAMTAGGLAVLAVAGTGLYAARRKKSAAGLA